ncbi:uncharacterized protein SAPINGB_P004148 [Magnusiomyces paraingens]|uniref:Alpha-MPP n=1 Tax=Magnusiomyces paraingens TaxID=2606893 RepID=A0A5E8BSZ8_9ASCO|nr:uncharacterized protein SAPINGB_P004148 [Saprochaete ingens]VVT54583.1 unnamed protein product [Saprochaete ingens]
MLRLSALRPAQRFASRITRVLHSNPYSTGASAPSDLITLDNGLRVAVDPSPSHFAAMGLYVHAGSRYENTPELSGLSHIVDRLAFKSTTTRSALTMQETLESLGGNYMCASSRESMLYQASVFNSDTEGMFALLADTVRNPAILPDELNAELATAEYEVDEIWQKPELILPEIVHMTAYDGTLGNPLLCPKERLSEITPASIEAYRTKFYHPDKIVASFVGVDTSTAVKLVEKYLGSIPKRDQATIAAANTELFTNFSHYTGGEYSRPSIPPIGNLPEFFHLHLAFEGLATADPDIYALATLQMLLGGGGSFSAGGPGKGMYSRLYTQVLNQFPYIESCIAFNHSYTDSGLFGISASCVPNFAPYLAEILCRQFSMTFTTGAGALTKTEVQRAKNQLRSSLLMNLESKMVQLEDMGRQILVQGYKVPVSEMCDKIDALTVEDIQRVARRVLTGNTNNPGMGSGKPTVVIQGRREYFGDVESVIKRYGLGLRSI